MHRARSSEASVNSDFSLLIDFLYNLPFYSILTAIVWDNAHWCYAHFRSNIILILNFVWTDILSFFRYCYQYNVNWDLHAWLDIANVCCIPGQQRAHQSISFYTPLPLYIVRGPRYLSLTRSLWWLLVPGLLTSPGHQHPWYWLCRIGKSLSYLRKDSNFLCYVNVE